MPDDDWFRFTILEVEERQPEARKPSLLVLKKNSQPQKERFQRKKVSEADRAYIWSSTNGRCYLCKTRLERSSAWHIEHVVAVSRNQKKNDILGNMLPACQGCNLRKSDRTLLDCIEVDLTFDLATFAGGVEHLSADVREEILTALRFKHERQNAAAGANKDLTEEQLESILEEIEANVGKASALARLATQWGMIERSSLELDYDDAPKISQGGFGLVYLAKWRRNHGGECIDCAVKVPNIHPREQDLAAVVAFSREIKTLAQLNHPNIVECYGWFREESAGFGVLLEYCNFTLSEPRALKQVQPVSFFKQVCAAVQHMHQNQLIHRDLKPDNILVIKTSQHTWSEAVAKLCDFGCVRTCVFGQEVDNPTRHAGTAAFRPPEFRGGAASFLSDVYSLGKTMQEIRRVENTALIGDPVLYSQWGSLTRHMTAYKPQNRPSLHEVKAKLQAMASPGVHVQLVATRSDMHGPPAAAMDETDALNDDLNQAASAQEPLVEETFVFVTKNAARREMPGGRSQSYHRVDTCSYLRRSELVNITLTEAHDFKHKQCTATCCYPQG
jgi:hypothetical protein